MAVATDSLFQFLGVSSFESLRGTWLLTEVAQIYHPVLYHYWLVTSRDRGLWGYWLEASRDRAYIRRDTGREDLSRLGIANLLLSRSTVCHL